MLSYNMFSNYKQISLCVVTDVISYKSIKIKKYLFIIFALLCSCSYAQNVFDNGALDNARNLILNKQTNKAKSELDKLHPQISSTSNSTKIDYYFLLGVLYHQKGDFQLAINELMSSLTFLYNRKDVDSEAYLKIAYYLADSFYQIGDFEKSESCINTALVKCSSTWESCAFTKKIYKILERICYKRNESRAIISQLQNEMQYIPDSIDDILDMNIIEEAAYQYDPEAQIKGVFIADYISMIDSICNSYIENGQYDLCIKTLDDVETEINNCGLQNHPMIGNLHQTKGDLYFHIRNIKEAKRQYIKAKKLFEQKEGTFVENYAHCLNSLALVFQEEKKYYYSTNMLYGALGIWKEHESTSKDYIQGVLAMYDNLARNYYLMDDREKALKTWRETLCIAEKNSIWEMAYSSACNYAYAMLESGDYKEGIDVLHKYLNHDINSYLKNIGLKNLLVLSYLYDSDNTIDILKDYIEFTKSYLTSILTSFSERERNAIWWERSWSLEMMTNAICMKSSTPELREMAYNTALYTKSMATRLPQFVADYVRNSQSEELQSIYEEYLSNKKRFIKRSLSNDSIQIISDQISRLEKKIFSNIDHRGLYDEAKYNCKEIQKQLGPKDVAVEFVIIPEFLSSDSSTFYYGAIIERESFESPVFLKLCNKDSLDVLFDIKDETSEYDFINQLYDINNKKIYRMVIDPMNSYINTGDNIYYSPVGMIHKLNLAAVPHEGKRLMDYYSFFKVSTTSNLLDNRDKDVYNSACVVGGIDYNESVEEMVNNTSRNHPQNNIAERSVTRGTWDDIPGSLEEAIFIDSLLSAHSVSSTLLTKGKANEDAIKALSGFSPDILHIATHGFYYSDARSSTSPLFSSIHSEIARNLPMQFCGLLFAGANNAWIGKELPSIVEDGILNAEEISLLDMSNTKLAVLSACDTGLGSIDDIDGVFGLQRGLKLAGVEAIVMSLWNIPDKETKTLMGFFYSNLMNGMGKSKAFEKAIERMRQSYSLPYYWASFIMLDGLN